MKKFKLILKKSLILTLFAVLMAEISWAQVSSSSLLGNGTEGSPYQIATAADWNKFASDVNGGYSYSGEIVQLADDITVTCTSEDNMVGTAEYSFKGTFDGDNKTLTFNYDQLDVDHVAPFRYINGATIKNLNVDGEIKMKNSKHYAGGLFCVNDVNEDSRSTITNCIVSLDLINRPDYSGGFANDAKNTTFTDCVYNGKLVIGRYSGGFSANGNNKTNINNCLCVPAEESDIWSGSAVFVKNDKAIVSADSYWTLEPSQNPNPSITTQGSRAYTTEPAVFTKYQQLIDGNYYYVEGNATITGLNYAYTYTGDPITVSYGLTFAGVALAEDTDFTADIDPATVQEKQTYTLTLTGTGTVYHGTISQTFDVIEGLTGEGTAESPYLIYSDTDWEIFTENINSGVGADAYYKLVNDITVGTELTPIYTVVGSDENTSRRFKGHFDGNWKTIEIYLQREDQKYAAPFGVIEDAVIENLAVTGKIKTNQQFAGGIAAYTYGTDTIRNCISSVEIDCSDIVLYPTTSTAVDKQYDCTHGGLVGQLQSGTLRFINCIFNGSILDKKSTKTARKCSGFCGWRGGTLQYTDCTMAGTIDIANTTATFHRKDNGTFTRAYYITPSYQSDNQGTEKPTTPAPTDGVYRKYTVSTDDYYVPGGVITGGVETTTYAYTGDPISTDPFVITYYGWTLTEGTDYDIVLTYSTTEEGSYTPVSVIQEEGCYKINITGKGNYGGTYTCPTIHVIDISTWSGLKTALAERNANITLTQDYSDDNNEGALVVSGTIVLDLNGHIINRNRTSMEDYGYVIKVEEDANLTINDSNPSATHTGVFASLTGGIITGGFNYGDGGGIYNDRGTLTLNNVTVYNNKCKYTGGGIYCAEKSNDKSSRFYMNGGAIRNNEAVGESKVAAGGGGIYANMAAAFQMDNVTVTGNRTISKGGGIRIKMSANNVTINGCTITNNVIGTDSESKGGGIYYDSNTNNPRKLTITDSEICANTVTKEGGGIYALKGTVELNNCTLAENVAGTSGGGVFVYGKELIVNGGVITENTSTNRGGGVYIYDYDGNTMQIKGDVQIIGNTSTNTDAENVYLAGSSDVIGVIGDITGANIGVSRGDLGTITSGLSGHGTDLNFTADNSAQWVLPYGGEAYLQNYYIWGVTEGWPNLTGITQTDNNYDITAVVSIPNGTTIAPPTTITLTGPSMLIVEDGGQLKSSTTLSPVIVKKNIEAAPDAGENTDGWYTIASPVNAPSITEATSLITGVDDPTFDLLRYDEPTHYWHSYNDNTAGHGDFSTLENGRGYLYRNANDVTVEFKGGINSGNVTYSLTNHGGSAMELLGFNLIGNPFTHNITLSNISLSAGGALSGGYVLNKAGAWTAVTSSSNISPCQGVLVQVLTDATATISPTASSKSRATEEYIQFAVANNSYEDAAYALFDESAGLNKIEHINRDIPMIYIHQNDEDYAIATMGKKRKSFDLNFAAKTTGRYTLSVKAEGNFSYIHVFDKLANKDIDMLKEKVYEFIGSPADAADRFVVRLGAMNSVDDEVFAYQSGSDIVVSGDGELQVFDIMGRNIMNTTINGVETINVKSHGVYIFKLNEKTQKIVVR